MAERFNLAGRRAVVTGGANGIGRAITVALAEAGAQVFFTTRADTDAAESLLVELRAFNIEAAYMAMEATAVDAPEQLFAAAEAAIGPVDVLVNNAAETTRTGFLDMQTDEYARTLDVNLTFPYFTLQRFARNLVARGEAGSAINISSISSFKAISRLSAYQCSKAGLAMLTKSAAYELAPYGIRVNTISPGLTATKGNRDQWHGDPALWAERGKTIPLARAGVPDDIAGAAVFLASDASAWMTGADLVIDGGDAVV